LQSDAELAVYNLNGQKIRILLDKTMDPGNHFVLWNGKDDNNRSVSSGIYFYKIMFGSFIQTNKIILLKNSL